MINKRLIKLSSDSLVHVKAIVLCQILSMLANVLLIFRIGFHISDIYNGESASYLITAGTFVAVIGIRSYLKIIIAKQGFKASSSVKINLRKHIYSKLLKLSGKYTSNISTAEIVQVSSEGVDQLEIYFANYLPQFFYCMMAPLILFGILSPISIKSSFVLFICVPLIPVSIIVIQKIAKKLLSKYWGLYASLGDDFLENIQGMTTLKIYGADESYHKHMNESAQSFRKVTMKVLSMQLNSIIVMDIVAYGGASLGTILAVKELANGNITIAGASIIILLAAEFFLPMRMLGSFFHIAMNGMAASEKMFKILDMTEQNNGENVANSDEKFVEFKNVSFSYDNEKQILNDINFKAPVGLTSIVGVSGSGKSTISSLIWAKFDNFTGEILINGTKISEIERKALYKTMTRVNDKGHIFGGTVRTNLEMAGNISDEQMINSLKKANIWDLFSSRDGLDTKISERGSNLSGGERQRLNIARALLMNSDVYIFDEVTSNIDVESEDDIMKIIHEIAKDKAVILISHRLQNVVKSNNILMLENGIIKENGTHEDLLNINGSYAKLYNTQANLESYRKAGV